MLTAAQHCIGESQRMASQLCLSCHCQQKSSGQHPSCYQLLIACILKELVVSAAWVIYDGDQRRVLAARDAEGSAAMHWGTTEDGRFMFGSDPIDLTDCNPTATPFPAGVPALCPPAPFRVSALARPV